MNELINIICKDSELLVSSREIAENFDKEHKHVIRDIEKHMQTLKNAHSPNLGYGFFRQSFYQPSNSNGRKYKEYLLTQDGFSLLVMGFTGQKAMEWKLKYIEAFNKMRELLAQPKESYLINDPIARAEQWIVEERERQSLRLENKQKEQIIGELKPKADYTDTILKSTSDNIKFLRQFAKETSNNLIKMKASREETLLVAENEDGQYESKIDSIMEGVKDNGFNVAFNGRYIEEILSAIQSDNVCIGFDSDVTPMIFEESAYEKFLLLPIRIS